MSLDDALPVARQIAEALDAAHAQGIIHRDLKPANIKLRPDGTVKVLDFGLAKAMAADATPADAGRSLTITSPAMTQLGVIMGTAAYMSPEQVRGRSIDKRSDIWAFGSVLFELLAGKRAFDGDDMSDTLANVLKREPDWTALPASTPANVRRVLRRCLEKDPRRRMHDIADARLELENPDDQNDEKKTGTIAAAPAVRRSVVTIERLVWTLIVGLVAGGLAYSLRRQPAAPPTLRFQVPPPEDASFGNNVGVGRADGTTGAALSPDGSQLAFVASQAGRAQIWLRRLDGFSSRQIAGTDGGMMPFWSPDSRALGFHADGKLKIIELSDGSIRTLADVTIVPRGAAWGSQDVVVFSSGTPPRLTRVSARGGSITYLDSPDVVFPRWPSFLPDGRAFHLPGALPIRQLPEPRRVVDRAGFGAASAVCQRQQRPLRSARFAAVHNRHHVDAATHRCRPSHDGGRGHAGCRTGLLQPRRGACRFHRCAGRARVPFGDQSVQSVRVARSCRQGRRDPRHSGQLPDA